LSAEFLAALPPVAYHPDLTHNLVFDLEQIHIQVNHFNVPISLHVSNHYTMEMIKLSYEKQSPEQDDLAIIAGV
jgi:hypothetical protein